MVVVVVPFVLIYVTFGMIVSTSISNVVTLVSKLFNTADAVSAPACDPVAAPALAAVEALAAAAPALAAAAPAKPPATPALAAAATALAIASNVLSA